MVSYVRAQFEVQDPQVAVACYRLSLLEPAGPDGIFPEDEAVHQVLLREGELQRLNDGAYRFTAPCVGEALRMLAPEDLQREL